MLRYTVGQGELKFILAEIYTIIFIYLHIGLLATKGLIGPVPD